VSAFACTPARSPREPTVSLRLYGGLRQATVTIDDEFIGPFDVVAAHGVALPIGNHRVVIEAPGYVRWEKSVEAKDQAVRLEVQLVPVTE
jgi:hypothetical protein